MLKNIPNNLSVIESVKTNVDSYTKKHEWGKMNSVNFPHFVQTKTKQAILSPAKDSAFLHLKKTRVFTQ